MNTIVCRVDQEDLQRLRVVTARSNALAVNPAAYSANESEQIEMANLRLTGEILDKYGINPARDWKLSSYTGDIWYED